METLSYKNIEGTIEYDEDDKTFYGKLLCVRGCCMYCGDNLEELERNFKEIVDKYLQAMEDIE